MRKLLLSSLSILFLYLLTPTLQGQTAQFRNGPVLQQSQSRTQVSRNPGQSSPIAISNLLPAQNRAGQLSTGNVWPGFGNGQGGATPLLPSTCGPDTVQYPLSKWTAYGVLNVVDSTAFAQWYPAPQDITVSGFCFYAWLDSSTNQSATLIAELYNSGNDSLPAGAPLATTTIQVDSNFFGGTVALLKKCVTFTTPVTVNNDYHVVIRNNSGLPVSILLNSITGTNGGQEWLSSAYLPSPTSAFVPGFNLQLSPTLVLDADFLFEPIVTYTLDAGYSPSPAATACAGISRTFPNTSSPIVGSRFYNQAATQGLTQFSYTWDWGDGSPVENVINGQHTYAATGSYTITKIDTIFGWNMICTDQEIGTVNVGNGVVSTPSFFYTTAGLSATFTDQSTGSPTSWAWDFGDGNTAMMQNPTHTYAANGVYTVCLTATNACGSNTTCQTVVIGTVPASSCDTIGNITGNPILYNAGIGYVAGHNNFQDSAKAERFTNNQNIAIGRALYWFGHKESNTPNTSKVVATIWDANGTNGTPGTILASQNLTYANIDTAGTNLTGVTFNPPIPVNGDFYIGIQLENNAGDTVGLITNFNGQTSPPTAWEKDSSGTWNRYDQTWGIDVSHAIWYVLGVQAAFTSSNIGNTATFTDGSIGANAWLWDFGDGNTSTQQNPTHVYAVGGSYNVCLIALNGTCLDTVCQTITLCNNPVATFQSNAVNLSVNFLDNSTGSPTSWAWDFGDGNTSTLQNPSHTYAVGGTYTVCLIATNACGSDTTCVPLTVVCANPVSGFTSISNGNTVTFTDASTNGPITAWAWDFGDGNTSALQSPTHTYANAGTYFVCLIATNVCGTDTFCDSVQAGCTTAIAAFTSTTSNLTANFTDGSSGSPTTWAWDFGDGNTSTLQNPNHTYAVQGTYTVCVTVSNGCGVNTICNPVTIVCPPPGTAFSSTPSTLTVSFTDNTTGSVTGWAWDFGDGNTSTTQSPTHTYAAAGVYTVCLVTTNACGNDTLCQPVSVSCPTPAAGFSFTAQTVALTFSDQSTGNPVSWSWDFGDGNTSTLQNPIHVYSTPGTYNVCLTATNACGANTTCQNVVVQCPIPIAGYTWSANQLVATFTDGTVGSPSTYIWNFGDGNSSISPNPTHTYAAPGAYTVCLITLNSCGGDTSCQTVTVSCPTPAPNFNFLTIGPNVDFTDLSTGGAVSWFWDFGDGSTSTLQNPSHTFATTDTFTVCLTVGNFCGLDTICQPVIISCVPPTAGFSFSVTQDSIATFTNNSSANTTAIGWDFGDGSTSTQVSPTHIYGAPGTYTVCQFVSNPCGLDTICQTVNITCVNPTAGFVAQVTNSVADFSDISILATQWSWDFGDGNSSNLQNPVHSYTQSGTYQVCLTVTNFCGTNTTCQNLVVTCNDPLAGFNYVNGAGVVDFTDLSTNVPTQWMWDFGDGATDTVQNPSHGYLFLGQFYVCLRATNACGYADTCQWISVTTIGIEEALLEESLQVFPNPSRDLFQISGVLTEAADLNFRVFDLVGKEVSNQYMRSAAGTFNTSIDLSLYAAGTYILEIEAGGRKYIKRLILE